MCAYAIELATTNYDFKQITTDFNTANIVEKQDFFCIKKRNKCIACIDPTVTEPSMSYQYTCIHIEKQDKSAWGGGVSFHRAV